MHDSGLPSEAPRENRGKSPRETPEGFATRLGELLSAAEELGADVAEAIELLRRAHKKLQG